MMEPLAPGTEDDAPLLNYSTSTKQEKERERLQSLKAILPNGRYGNIFDLKYINGAEHWYCNACACPVMGWVFHHEAGKRHKLALGNQKPSNYPNSPEMDEATLQIAPGEPLPPGFEGHVEKISLIQERLDAFNVGPLVALEYLLELRDYDVTKEPTYLCILCDKKGDPRTVLTHLASYKHILQYLQKHFPTCYRALAPYMTKQYKRNWQTCVHEIAEAIEKKFGRLKPMPVDNDKFEKDQFYYLQMIAQGRHFSELSGYTFEELVNKDELTKIHEDEVDKLLQSKKKSPSPPVVLNPIKKIKQSTTTTTTNPQSSSAVGHRRRSLSSVSSISNSDLSDYDDSKDKEKVYNRRSRSRSPASRYYRDRSPSPYSRRYERRSSPPPSRRDGVMPWERSNYRRSKTDHTTPPSSSSLVTTTTTKKPIATPSTTAITITDKEKLDKMDEYKKLCKAIDNDMERVLKNHKKNPEKHPQYNDEWKQFWNKRYKELQLENKDVTTHDFKPEWICYWNKRMIELHQDELKQRKEALRKRLGIDEPSPVCFKITGKKKYEPHRNSNNKNNNSPNNNNCNKPIPPSVLPDNDPEVIIIDDRDDESKTSKRSHSPWEEDNYKKYPTPKEKHSRERCKRSFDRSPSLRSYSPSPHRSRSPINNNSPPPSSSSRRLSSHSPHRRSPPSSSLRSRNKDWDNLKSRDYHRNWERVRVVSELPWERKNYRNELPSYYKPPAVMRDVTREPVLTPSTIKKPTKIVVDDNHDIDDHDDNGDINIVAVLRLLTALEEKLGSLGPKIIDLLSNALAMEKNEANSSETLLDNEINCVLFETVKEKLKGQLLAGLVEPIQVKAFKNAIKKTASLIHMGSERKKEIDKKQQLTNNRIDPVQIPGIGNIDKAAIARQIANALVLQGKTDVTQNELEQLINAVIGMAEASRRTNKPITTASFLEEITKNRSQSIAIVNKEKTPPPPTAAATTVTSSSSSSLSSLKSNDDNRKSLEKPATPTNNMEGLSDSDLQTLLQNFKDLSTEEQHGLINYLKKLENQEPERVERLRKFVNLDNPTASNSKTTNSGRNSPFSNRLGSLNPPIDGDNNKMLERKQHETTTTTRMCLDSDEDDYTYEDVVKAASKNVKENELAIEEDKQQETKGMLLNILDNMPKTTKPTTAIETINLFNNLNFNNPDLTNTLNNLPVNMANLANIVGSVQNLTANYNKMVNQALSAGFTQQTPVSYPAETATNASNYPGQSFYQQPQQQQQQQQQLPKVAYPNLGNNDQSKYSNYGYYDQHGRLNNPTGQQQNRFVYDNQNRFGGGGGGGGGAAADQRRQQQWRD